jgi:hypothetical protein
MTSLLLSEYKTGRRVCSFLPSLSPSDLATGLLQILAETYQAMPSYRVCTAHGVTQLTEGLASKLRGLLEARAREESKRANS